MMTVRELKEAIKDLPDDMEVAVEDDIGTNTPITGTQQGFVKDNQFYLCIAESFYW